MVVEKIIIISCVFNYHITGTKHSTFKRTDNYNIYYQKKKYDENRMRKKNEDIKFDQDIRNAFFLKKYD
jgi:hypothetical protein